MSIRDSIWIEVLAVHIKEHGDWYRGEVRRVDSVVGEDWVARGIVRKVEDPSVRTDLPRATITLQPADGSIGGSSHMV